MLIAMLTVFLLGGGLLGGSMLTPTDVDLISERISLLVDEPARAATAQQVLDELKIEVEAFDEIFIDSGDTLRDLYLDHEAGSRQMLSTLESLNLEWYVSQQRSLKLRDRLRKSIIIEEWAAVFDN
jgi:hypothetical protein